MTRYIQNFHESLMDHLLYTFAKDTFSATPRDKFNAMVLSVRENIVERWMNTQQQYYYKDVKRVYYLSLEFLLGRLLRNYTINLNLPDDYSQAVDILGVNYEEILEHEWDAGLGNGGLGRLAACFLDSLATLGYPAYGYGIRYEYGIFLQKILNGYQVEAPDNWLRYGNPWEFPRPEILYPVRFYGRVNTLFSDKGKFRMEWTDTENVMAMAYDYPVPGFHNNTVNTLRLWSAKSSREFNLEYFNSGDYIKAVQEKSNSETISKVLYPDDQTFAGKELRLKQQYLCVSATIRDIIRRYRKHHETYKEFHDKVAIQLNDTHPAIGVAELMRILVDEDNLSWDDAWEITKGTFAYTNHTVLPEALETWSEGLMGHLLPRHLQIIQEIDRRFIVQVSEKFPNEPEQKWQMSIITGDGDRWVHMARLAIVGSHTVNGVSRLHTDILKTGLFWNYQRMQPDKFRNVTNGITPRRWLLEANKGLADIITDAIGDGWIKNLDELIKLEPLADDAEFRRRCREVKRANKTALAAYVPNLPPSFLLDCQIKRFHEYKRQLLNILHVATLYNRILEGRTDDSFVPRAILFAGKAAPGYYICKLFIKLIHCISDTIMANPETSEKLRVVFAPNYGVSLAQRIIPAAELSEQISTAGYEASGTGNMKFTLNGALTIGTLDGANVEIREEVGEDNFFLFGLTAEEIMDLKKSYNPLRYYEGNEELRKIIDQLSSGYFSPGEPGLFSPVVRTLLEHDRFFVLADYASYIKCQEKVSAAYRDREQWMRMAILNIARSGKFSSDRAIREYSNKIWKIEPLQV
jgi:starch phosphorylase